MKGLTIYRASAGSGKTFALARDLILLVLRVPEKFQHILAVTFTNKATDEMKTRILSELHRLAVGDTSDMREFLEHESGMTGVELQKKAREVLDTILHNYSRFHVETIDRFFQRAIRVFAREIGLASGYRVELEPEPVLVEAIEMMLRDLDGDPELLEWISGYARERVEAGKHWNLKRDILELGKQINRERFQEKGEALRQFLNEKAGLRAYKKELDRIRHGWEGRLAATGSKAVEIMDRKGLAIGDFKGVRSGIGSHFIQWAAGEIKEPTATILKSRDDFEAWVKKGSEARERVLAAYHAGLRECLNECMDLFGEPYGTYLSAIEAGRYLNELGILNEISARMHEYTRDQGIFLLSDSPRFLHGIIDGNEAPFIYEKIGNHFHHYMIDEFQDTSSMQWKNFLPLIDNSLAFMRENLVVGDVKQSIYRWRNSDWEILSEKIHRQFAPDQMELKTLDQNWRSRENIIAFNNDFFEAAIRLYADYFDQDPGGEIFGNKIRNAYASLAQRVPELPCRTGGTVHVRLFEDNEGNEWKSAVNREVIRHIEMLQDNGFRPSDITILVRRKTEGREIADLLLAQKADNRGAGYSYDVISNESLFLINAHSIRIILCALKYLDRPEDRINHSNLLIEYSRLDKDPEDLPVEEILSDGITGDRHGGSLPSIFFEEAEGMKYLTLPGLMERLITIFSLNRHPSEVPYLLAFQDLVLEYSKNNPADINSFLQWWNEHGEDRSLALPGDQEAMRVMTIHKAKGLEFRAVILPYCNWSLDHIQGFGRKEIIWCQPAPRPFDRLPLLPVGYSGALKNTIFRNDYYEERFRIFTDNLNLLYVALTRARDSLVVFGRRTGKQQLRTSSDLLEQILMSEDMPSCGGMTRDVEKGVWETGQPLSGLKEVLPRSQGMIGRLTSHPFSGRLRLKYRGKGFFDPESTHRISQGKLFHEVFSRIHTMEDVDLAVDKTRREGLLNGREAEETRLKISRMLQVEPFREWFSGSWSVITEKDILVPGGVLKRPDRVMLKDNRLVVVDYKFGRARPDEHLRQVRQYIDTLERMDYTNITGYLWYFQANELVEV